MGGMGKKLMGGIGEKLGGIGKNLAGKAAGAVAGGLAGGKKPVNTDPFADDESGSEEEPQRYGPSKEQKEDTSDTRSPQQIMRNKKAFADKYFKK